MKKMINIAMLKVIMTFKNKTALTSMFIAPIIFVLILVIGFGSGGGNSGETKYPIDLVNMDKGYYSEQFINILKQDKTFLIAEREFSEAKEAVEGNRTALAIVIPEGFSEAIENEKNKEVEILKLQSTESTIAIAAVINNYLLQLRISERTGEAAVQTLASHNIIKDDEGKELKGKVENSFINSIKSPTVSYTVEKAIKDNKPGMDGISSAAIGILVMFITFFATGGAGAMLEEKETGTWKRINSTPTRGYSILGGYILGNFLQGWVQVGVLIIVSRYMFNINWGNSTLGLIMLFSSFLLAIIGLGSALSSFVKTRAQLSSLSSIVVMPTCLLAGCFWPREIMPDIMVKIADFVPQTWVLKGMTDLVTRGSELSAIILPSTILLIFAGVFFTVGLTFMSIQKEN